MILTNIVLFVILCNVSEGARILGYIPTPSYSHQVVFQPLWKELSLRGHQVTVLTTNPINDPSLANLTEIDLSFSYKHLEDNLLEIINSSQNVLKTLDLSMKSFLNVWDNQLQHSPVQKIINDPNVHFDLIIGEVLFSLPIYFSRKFNCPFVGLVSVDAENILYSIFGNPTHPIVYPQIFAGIYDKPNIIQRVYLLLVELLLDLGFKSFLSSEQELIWKHFRDNTPIAKVRKDISLVFVNANPIFDAIRPLVPSVIQIGGNVNRISIKPLQQEIKEYLDQAREGFIYFSLGSNVKSKDIPTHTLNVILHTFEELPYKVLWKYELSELKNKPNNVIVSEWVSQLEVLRHPNLKLFITHGGGQSVEEAYSARVPLLGMPFFVDQPYNIKKMVAKGCAVYVNYREMTKTEFKSAILEVIQNPKYRNRINELADLAEDQPMSGLERAIWWTEYVIRHKGAPHLRSPLLDIPWYQYYLVDVISVILITIIITIGLFIISVKWFINFLRFACRSILKDKHV